MKTTNDESGFSLLEVTIAMAVMTVILGVVFTLFNRLQVSYRHEIGYAEAARNGRFAVARLNEIIRSAGTNPTGKTTVNWLSFVDFGGGNSSSSLHLLSDLNGDGGTISTVAANSDVIITSENVTLQLDTNTHTIMMVDNNQPVGSSRRMVPIAENIRSLTFSDPDGSRREVDITLTAGASGFAPGDPNYREVRYTTNIRLRNR